jgi:hypothetical protein
LTPL